MFGGENQLPPIPNFNPPPAPAPATAPKVSLSVGDFERMAKAIAFRLREVEDSVNRRVAEGSLRGEEMSAPSGLEKSVTIGELIMWYLEEVVAKRGGGDVAAVLAERKTVKLVIKHLLRADRDMPTLFYAEQYEEGDGIDFESKRVELNPVRFLNRFIFFTASPSYLTPPRSSSKHTHRILHTHHNTTETRQLQARL